MLNRFDGLLVNEDINNEDREKFLDNFKELDNYFFNIRMRSNDYLEYINL